MRAAQKATVICVFMGMFQPSALTVFLELLKVGTVTHKKLECCV